MSLRIAVILLTFAAAGCAGSADVAPSDGDTVQSELDSVCPTASAGSPSLFFWHTTRQLEQVVWSSDGKQIGGVELIFEQKKSWDPLAGTTLKRKFCHQLSTWDGQLKFVKYIGPMQVNQAGEIFFMQPAGYFTAQSYVRDAAGGWDFHRVALDGTRKLLAHVADGCQYGRVLPSPDGSHIAYLAVAGHCNDGLSGNDVVVTFFDSAGNKLADSPSVNLPGGAAATWTPAGDLILTDGTKSVRVFLSGTTAGVANAPVPHCTDPGTTSSTIGPDGRTLGFDANGKPTIVSTDKSTAFGCQ